MPHRRTRSYDRLASAAEDAALLEAAQQQATAEEEIRTRLPHEVLQLQRRLEHQQSSVESIQGNLSKLTEMVVQISLTVTQQPSPGRSSSGVTDQGLQGLQTPPQMQPHQNLSPIPEISTPTPTPISDLAPLLKLHDCETDASSSSGDREADAFQRQAAASPATTTTMSTLDIFFGATTAPTPSYSSATPASTPLSGFKPSAGSTATTSTTSALFSSAPSVFPVSAYTVPPVTAYVAPRVFGEMPAQKSWQETHGTTPSYYPGHEKPIKNSGVQSVSTSSGWQNLDEMPQQYDFHNLNRKSVFRADGTEQSYFALPENYPLQRAVPEPVRVVGNGETEDCSTQFVQVITGTLEKHGSTDPSLIDSEIGCKHEKAHTVDRRVSILNMLAPIQAKLQNISENLSWYPYLKRMETQGSKQPATSQPKHSTREAIVLSDEMPLSDVYAAEDKGCSKDFVDVSASTPEQQPYEEDQRETEQPPKCFSRPNFSPERPIVGTVGVFSLTNESNNLLFAKQNIEQLLICSSTAPQCSTYEEESQGDEKILWEKPVCQTATGHSISYFLWDPGATAFSVLFPTVADATKLQCTYVYNPELVHVLAENLGAQAAPIFASATVCYLACERGWTVVNASAELVLAVQISEATSVAKHALFLLSQDNSFIMQRAAHLSESLTWHGSLPGTPFLLLNITNYTWDPGVSKLKDTVLDKCAVQVQFVQQSTELSLFSLEFSTSSQKRVQWDPGVKVSLYCWFNILTVWREIATPFWQNQGISASYVWDPGTMLLWYKAKWWLLFTEENISCHGDIKCYGVALWLIHFQPP